MANKAQNLIPKHSRIEGQTIQWPIKHKKLSTKLYIKTQRLSNKDLSKRVGELKVLN
jgi:hypothetical protein